MVHKLEVPGSMREGMVSFRGIDYLLDGYLEFFEAMVNFENDALRHASIRLVGGPKDRAALAATLRNTRDARALAARHMFIHMINLNLETCLEDYIDVMGADGEAEDEAEIRASAERHHYLQVEQLQPNGDLPKEDDSLQAQAYRKYNDLLQKILDRIAQG